MPFAFSPGTSVSPKGEFSQTGSESSVSRFLYMVRDEQWTLLDWNDNLIAIIKAKLTFKNQSLSIVSSARLTPFCHECTEI